jgi:CDP-diacylglycerol--glycerol-3-phosphate 3-phosphatidyltransferase
MKSKKGAILNELTDVISDAAIFLPFAYLPETQAGLVTLIVLLALISEMAGVLGITIGASRRYDGPMGKSDRAFVFGLIGLLIGLGLPILPYLNAAWYLVILLLGKTIWNRCTRALSEASGVSNV